MKTHILLLCIIVLGIVACNGQNKSTQQPAGSHGGAFMIPFTAKGEVVSEPGKNIDCIFQDKKGVYWFASNGDGVYRYNGKTLQRFTEKDGLVSNFVWSIQEDQQGYLWFTTRDGISRYDGTNFKNYTDTIVNAPYSTLNYTAGGLFFNHTNGICLYDGKSFTNFTIHPPSYTPEKSSMYRPYGTYCALADKSGTVWFGTQEKGVCKYDGNAITYITDKDLAGPAVRAVYQDKAGIYWFGNNGGGFFRYDGHILRNITEEKNLGNSDFLRGRKLVNKPGSLARVFAINEDEQGAIWIGTADAGVWRYDGTSLMNYTPKDGLSGNSVTVIYKDKKGDLWFVSNGDTILRFNGHTFTKVTF